MANWLEIANTLINLETMSRVGDLARGQQQILTLELIKLRDNHYLSQLVDLLVKIRQFQQDEKHFDVVLSGTYGVLLFKQLYPQFADAEAKLRSSEIHLNLLEIIKISLSEPDIRQVIQREYQNFLTTFNENLNTAYSNLRSSEFELVKLDPSYEWEFELGEELTPYYTDVFNINDRGIMFIKGKPYPVVEIDETRPNSFFMINERGQKQLLNFEKNGGAEFFAFFKPRLPSAEKEVTGWRFCNKIFNQQFLAENVKPFHDALRDIRTNAYSLARISDEGISLLVEQYEKTRADIVKVCLAGKKYRLLPSHSGTGQNIKNLESVAVPWKISNSGLIFLFVLLLIVLLFLVAIYKS
jgi:hypothetical protein